MWLLFWYLFEIFWATFLLQYLVTLRAELTMASYPFSKARKRRSRGPGKKTKILGRYSLKISLLPIAGSLYWECCRFNLKNSKWAILLSCKRQLFTKSFFIKYGPIPASFSFIFVLFTSQFNFKLKKA